MTNSETRVYSFKPEFNTLIKQNDAISKLKEIIKEKNTLLNNNDTFGPNGRKGAGGSYTIDNKPIPCQIVCDISYKDFSIEVVSDDIDLTTTLNERNSGKTPLISEADLQVELDRNNTFNSGKSIKTLDKL